MRGMLFVLLSIMLVSCGDTAKNSNETTGGKQKDAQKHDLMEKSKEYDLVLQDRSVATTNLGTLAYLQLKKSNLVYSDSTHSVTIDKTPANKYWLTISGKFVYVFWWVKYNTHEEKDRNKAGKVLYVNVSNNNGKTFGKAIRLNDHHGVLPDLHIQATTDGRVSVVYLDERYGGHQIFTNSSRDGGKTWLEHDIELNQVSNDADEVNKGKKRITAAVTPNLLQLGDKLIAIWEQIETFNEKRAVSFLSRTSLDFGKTWSESELIHRDFKRLSVELYSTTTNNEAFLFAVLEEGLAMFIKSEDGVWERSKEYVPGTERGKTKIVSYFKTAFDKDYLYVTYINVEGQKNTDNHTEFQAYHREKKTWSRKYRFDKLADSARDLSRGYFQDISILKNGSLVAVWEDYRGIFPSIFMSSSTDQGKNWTPSVPLNKVGLESANIPFIKAVENGFFVFYKYVVLANALQPRTRTRQLTLPIPGSQEFTKVEFPKITLPDKKKSMSILKNRVNNLMMLRKTKELEKMIEEWSFLDPIYKSFNTQTKWLDQRNMFDYIDYRVLNISLKGATALVKIRLSYRLNAKFISAKANKKEIQKEVTVMKWGWFYDNWYLIPDNPKQSYLP